MVDILISTSGWHYKHWWGLFYPGDLKPSDRLTYFSKRFKTVEINSTLYEYPSVGRIALWLRKTPEDFVFAVKMNRFITHYQRLENVEESLDGYERVPTALGKKLGIILIQLPASLKFDAVHATAFFKLLRSKNLDRRYALEARHSSWLTDEVYELLAKYNMAWSIADSGGRFPTAEQITASYTYLRFHGPGALVASSYSDDALRHWSDKICRWKEKKLDVYVYFNKDFGGFAPKNAQRLIELIRR